MSILARIQHLFTGGGSLGIVAPITPAPNALTGGERAGACTREELEALLDSRAAALGLTTDWRDSAQELLHLLGLDDSLARRWQLAETLGYEGNFAEITHLNRWLHCALLEVLAEHGGRLPESLRPVDPAGQQ